MARHSTRPDKKTHLVEFQIAMVPDVQPRSPRTLPRSKLSTEERRMAKNAKRIQEEAASGKLVDVTGLRGEELLAALLGN